MEKNYVCEHFHFQMKIMFNNGLTPENITVTVLPRSSAYKSTFYSYKG